MKLDLPDDHPIAEAIRYATDADPMARIFLTLTNFGSNGATEKLIFAEIDSWTRRAGVRTYEGAENRFECSFSDPDRYKRALEAMTQWPEPCIDTD